jgi:hypothetical protein
VLRLADSANLGPVPARLVDLSAGGVGVRLQRPLAPGKQFTLEVPGVSTSGSAGGSTHDDGAAGAGGEAKALRYRVVRCKPLGQGAFHVGAAFVRTPAPTAARASAANSANTANRTNAAAAANAAATDTTKRA